MHGACLLGAYLPGVGVCLGVNYHSKKTLNHPA